MSVIDEGTGNLALVGNFFGYCETLKSMPNEARLGLQNTDCECHKVRVVPNSLQCGELRRIGWKVEDFDIITMLREPGPHDFAPCGKSHYLGSDRFRVNPASWGEAPSFFAASISSFHSVGPPVCAHTGVGTSRTSNKRTSLPLLIEHLTENHPYLI